MDTTTSIPVSAATAAPFAFPSLKTPELIQCMQEVGIDLTETELQEPHRYKDKLRLIFLRLLELCTGKTEEDFMPSSALLDKVANTVSNPELYQDCCWNEVHMFQCLRKCMATCGIPDFGLRDLHHPTASRTSLQLSAFINLVKFREDQLKFYLELHEPRSQILLRLEELKSEHSDLLIQLEEAKESNAELRRQEEEAMKECEELELEIAHYNQLQRSQRQAHNELKRQATELQDHLKAAIWEMQEVQSQEEKLLGAIVSSPERRIAKLEQTQQRLTREKKECQVLREKLQQMERHKDNVLQAIQLLDDTYYLAADVKKASQKYQDAVEQFQALQFQVDNLNAETREKEEQVAHAQQMLQQAQTDLSEWRQSSQQEYQALQQTLAMRKAELDDAQRDRLADLARIEQGQAEVQRMERAIQEEQRHMEEDMKQVIQAYQKLERDFIERDQTRLYHHRHHHHHDDIPTTTTTTTTRDE